jgi:hypothetical protein
VNITGGTLGDSLGAHPGSVVNISGGLIGQALRAFDDSVVNLRGTEFLLDGVSITGPTPGAPFAFMTRTGVLSGHLKDGSPFSIFLKGGGRLPAQLISPNAVLNLIVVPEPTGAFLLLVAFVGVGFRSPMKCSRRFYRELQA